MSEVFSFRLNKNNPREAKAFQVLQEWGTQGYSTRYVIIEALLNLGGFDSDLEKTQLESINDMMAHIEQFLIKVDDREITTTSGRISNPEPPIVTDSFLASVNKSMKPGLKLE
jgi:hypothetical protein